MIITTMPQSDKIIPEKTLLSDYSLVFHKVYFYIPSMHKLLNLEE
jgi:hypothetical protein